IREPHPDINGDQVPLGRRADLVSRIGIVPVRCHRDGDSDVVRIGRRRTFENLEHGVFDVSIRRSRGDGHASPLTGGAVDQLRNHEALSELDDPEHQHEKQRYHQGKLNDRRTTSMLAGHGLLEMTFHDTVTTSYRGNSRPGGPHSTAGGSQLLISMPGAKRVVSSVTSTSE